MGDGNRLFGRFANRLQEGWNNATQGATGILNTMGTPLIDRQTGQLTPLADQYQGLVQGFAGSSLATEAPALGAWFGRSKVVDDAGKPLVVYHGSRGSEPVQTFDQNAAQATGRWTNDEGAGSGFHFTPDKEIAEGYGSQVGQYHLKMENPKKITEGDVQSAQQKWLRALEDSDDPEEYNLAEMIKLGKAFDNPGSGYYNYGLSLLTDQAKANGHDGVIFSRAKDFLDPTPINEYISFDPGNIRPADTH